MDEERQEVQENRDEGKPVSDYNEAKQIFVQGESEAPNVSFG